MSTTAPRYRVPCIQPEVEEVSLADFDIEEIREYLHRKDHGKLDKPAGAASSGFSDPLLIESDDLDRIATLALCGQKQHAQQHVLSLVSEHLGRDLT
jgi:hypothetical protein